MAIIDIILGGLLLYGLIRGAWKGFFSELASLLSLLVGLYAAIAFSDYVGEVLSDNVSWDPKYISITAFAITFIAVVVGIILLGKFFTKLASFAMLGWLNKLLGGVFGFLKWALLLSVILHFFIKINGDNLFADKKTLNDSWFFYPIAEVATTIFPVMEEWFVDIKDDVIEGLDKSI